MFATLTTLCGWGGPAPKTYVICSSVGALGAVVARFPASTSLLGTDSGFCGFCVRFWPLCSVSGLSLGTSCAFGRRAHPYVRYAHDLMWGLSAALGTKRHRGRLLARRGRKKQTKTVLGVLHAHDCPNCGPCKSANGKFHD